MKKQFFQFVKTHKLETLRETLSLEYPSYILSLVMGTGKTILIGSIYIYRIYTEFALSLVTKNGIFLKNALVFALGKTILGSLIDFITKYHELPCLIFMTLLVIIYHTI